MPSPLQGETGVRTITPGEYMLQAAQVSQGFADSMGRAFSASYGQTLQNKQETAKLDLLKQKQAADAAAVQELAQWQSQVQNIQDPMERIRAMSKIPSHLWTNDTTRQAITGMANVWSNEYKVKSELDNVSGIADHRKFRGELFRLGVPMESEPGDPIYDEGVKLHRERRALSIAAEAGLTQDQVNLNQLPTLANGRLDEEMFKSSAMFASPLHREKMMTADMRNAAELTRLENLVNSLPEGSPERQSAQNQLSNFQTLTAPAGMEITTDATGQTTIRTGVRGRATTATQALIEKQKLAHRQIGSEMARLQTDLRQEDLGAWGWIGDNVMDRWVSQTGIQVPDKTRVDNRTRLKMTVQGMLRVASTDSRFTENDRKRIEAIAPSLGPGEQVDRAKQALKTLREMLAKRTIWDIEAVNGSLAFNDLTNDEIIAAFQEGYGPDGKKRILKTSEDWQKLASEVDQWVIDNGRESR